MQNSKHSLLLAIFLIFALGLVTGCGAGDSGNSPPVDGDSDEPDGDISDGDTDAPVDGDTDEISDGDVEEDTEAPATLKAFTTVQRTLQPTVDAFGAVCEDNQNAAYCENPGMSVGDLSAFYDFGMGEWEIGEGEDFAATPLPGATQAEPGERRALFRWAHMTDIHITDEESPNRMAGFDSKAIPSALRPMDMLSEATLNAAVETINYFNRLDSMSLVLISGDFSDNAQKNEAQTLITILDGGTVDPDSGDDDDPIAGPDNDCQDPFTASGLDVPWIVTFGNHDELILGNWPVTEETKASGMGSDAASGARDGKTFEVVTGEIPADSDREPMTHTEMMGLFLESNGAPQGHGFSQSNQDDDKGYYAYDPPEYPLIRVIMLDSAYRPLGYDGDLYTYVGGVIDREQFDEFLIPQLDDALLNEKLVIVSSHHGSRSLTDDGFPDRFVSGTELTETLATYPNVLVHCIGHSHENTVSLHDNETATGGYAEIQSSSLLDWPQQFRFYELVDNGNGTLSVFTVVIDHADEPGSLSEESRRRALIDVQSGWGEGGPGMSYERNVELIYAIPDGYEDAIQNANAMPKSQALSDWR